MASRSGQWCGLKYSWTSVPRVLWRVVWYSKRGSSNPSHQCRPGVARRQLSKYLLGRNPAGARLFSVVPSNKADASGHKIKLLRFLVNAKSDLYCEDKQWDRFPEEVVCGLHPWKYLKPSPGHGLDVALGTGAGQSSPWSFLIVSVSLWHGLQINLVLNLCERVIRTEAGFCLC